MEVVSQTLPFITVETADAVIAQYRLDKNNLNPGYIDNYLVTPILSEFSVANPDLAMLVGNTVQTAVGDVDARANQILSGIAIVLATYNKQSGYIIDNLRRLDEKDLGELKTLAEKIFFKKGNILLRLIHSPKLPDTEIELNRIINSLKISQQFAIPEITSGATFMYELLAKFWPKLSSPPPTHPQMTK